MADYMEYRQTSREPSYMRHADSAALRRSMTRGSYYSHGSVSASTKSWVYSTQQNPPPPPTVDPMSITSPPRTHRPLPDPQYQNQVLYTTNPSEIPEDEEEEYMNIDPDVPSMFEGGYQSEPLGKGRRVAVTPLGSPKDSQGGNKSFVGGFVSGLKRLPRAVLRYGNNNEKKRFGRRGTFGTEGTVTSATGMTSGNTLPRYASNPSTPVAGPSNVQYAHQNTAPLHPHPLMNVALPPPTISSPPSRRHRNPSFRITPPSDEVITHATDNSHLYNYTPNSPPEFTENPTDLPTEGEERATVMMYHEPVEAASPEPTAQAQTTIDQRISHVSHTPSQVLSQSHGHDNTTPVQSPVVAHPLPAEDYLKMSLSNVPTSRHTVMTTTTTSFDPSFSSQLNPVEKFFHVLYHLPWISPKRVTVDYRPGNGPGGQSGGRGVTKKPMMSWYRKKGAKSGSGNGDIDLLSNGTASGSARTSLGTNITQLASPLSGRDKRPTDRHRRRRHRHHAVHTVDDHERRRRRRRETTSTMTSREIKHQRSMSPLIPPLYPFQYPAYTFQYPTFPPPAQPTPRGPRSHRTPTYPHGYSPYQPMPAPPPAPAPVYVWQSSNGSPDSGHTQIPTPGQVLSPVYMQLVPGAFPREVPVSSPNRSPTPAQPAAQRT